MMNLDSATAFAQAALRLCLVNHPKRTALGIGSGVTASTLINAFGNILPLWINKLAFTDFNMIVVGVFSFNLPLLFSKDRLPEHIEDQLTLVQRARSEKKISPAQAKVLYAAIVKQAFEETKLNTKTQVRVDHYDRLLHS
jgi:hypothetical protein